MYARTSFLLLAAASSAVATSCSSLNSTSEASIVSTEQATVPTSLEASDEVSFELAFNTHLDMELPEQDVYIERVKGSGNVFRVTAGDHDMSAELFATAEPVPHNPFDPAAVGPHPKGSSLGMTLGQWLRHQGTCKYRYADGVGTLELSLSGLVPNGVYTIWHAFMAFPPTEPFSGTLDLPLGARDGSESVFTADANGKIEFEHSFSPGLEMSDVWTTSMIAINYHSDGKTYKAYPGDFGLNAHIPLFVFLPSREGIQ